MLTNRTAIALLLSLFAFSAAACAGDDDPEKETNVATNNATTNNATTNNATTNNATTNNATTNNATTNSGTADAGTDAGEACGEGEAFDAPLDGCVTCPNTAYNCDSAVAQGSFDRATSTFSFTPAEGSASIVEASLGFRVYSGMTSEEFAIEGVLDGRTMTFDVSQYETTNQVQIYEITLTDSCGETSTATIVGNYDPEATDPVEPYCPLGG